MTVIRDRDIENNSPLAAMGAFAPGPSLLDRAFMLRDRLFAAAWFQRWAAGFPLVRGIARRQAGALFDLCAGFVYSQVLKACVELRLFEHLSGPPLSVDDLAQRMGLSREACERLLLAAASLKLVARRSQGRYGLAMLGAALAGNQGIADMVRHHRHLYADLADPVALLRGEVKETALSRYWAYAKADALGEIDDARVAEYSALMSASLAAIAEDVLDAYSFARHKVLLDVGGGEGAFLCAAAARFPHLRLKLLDLPPVAARARERFARAGLDERAEAIGGSFLDAPLPRADAATLIRVLLDHDDATVLALLTNLRRSLEPGATLVVAEPMAATPGAEAMGDAYFGFYLMAMGRGRPRTPKQLADLMLRAGFEAIKRLPARRPFMAQIIAARTPACAPAGCGNCK